MGEEGQPAGSNVKAPTPEAVRDSLERVLQSPEFTGSERIRKFLRFIVEETLAGRADRIKAYSIAIVVFERDDSFDPLANPVVRIEAGRLRRRLERYYLTAGTGDPVRIDVPKGGYVPTFTFQDQPLAELSEDPMQVDGGRDCPSIGRTFI